MASGGYHHLVEVLRLYMDNNDVIRCAFGTCYVDLVFGIYQGLLDEELGGRCHYIIRAWQYSPDDNKIEHPFGFYYYGLVIMRRLITYKN